MTTMLKTLPLTRFHTDGKLPEHGEVFVFGSNLAGRHGAGAAKAALDFGAVPGIGVGLQGKSYAIPTKDADLRTLSLREIAVSVRAFLEYAHAQFGKDGFFVSRIGCGLAGYRDRDIAPMFLGAPINCSFAEQWRVYLTD